MTNTPANVGGIAAQKMLHILEDFRDPQDIAITPIGNDISYEVHLNQLAMRAQGLDPNLLIPLVLEKAFLCMLPNIRGVHDNVESHLTTHYCNTYGRFAHTDMAEYTYSCNRSKLR